MPEPLRVAIIGAGIGAQHLDAFHALPDSFTVDTICDLNADRAAPLIALEPGAKYTADFETVLADPAIDIVDICLPPHLHLSACLGALSTGKQVICEKPLVATLEEFDRLAEAEARASGRVFPVFQYRYGRGAAQLRALIDAGLAGRPFTASLETHWDRGAEYYAVDWRGTWAGERGGAVLTHAIHIHDLLTYLLGPVATVHADLATRVNDIEVEDCAALAIRMRNGALVTSSVTLGAATDTSRLRLCFEGLTAESGTAPYAPADSGWTFTARPPFDQANIDAVTGAIQQGPTGFVGLFAAIAAVLGGGPDRTVTLLDARRSLEFVTAVYASSRSNQPVCLTDGSST